jgi:hypothetical protein
MRYIIRILLCWSLVLSVVDGATNAPVRELNIVSTYGDSAEIFDKVVELSDLQKGVGYFLQHTIEACRSNAAAQGKSPQSIGSMGGRWLEWAVLLALKENKLTPAYWQAKIEGVPSDNDVMLWSEEHGPVVLSCKTSLRERYKQADLEAIALRARYQHAKAYLITLDSDKRHVARTRSKIRTAEVVALQAIYDETNVDDLFAFLKTLALADVEPKLLRSGKVVR